MDNAFFLFLPEGSKNSGMELNCRNLANNSEITKNIASSGKTANLTTRMKKESL